VTYFPTLRRRYILWRLATAGEVQRADIARTFGVSMSQATADMRVCMYGMPDLIKYDKSAKRYMLRIGADLDSRELDDLALVLGWS
jgi:predicted DNA-binding transcriptional regulator YafY